MRLQLNAVIFITLSLGKLPFISSSKNPTQTQNITLAELERVVLKFLQNQPDARRRLGNKTLLQVAALLKENQEDDASDSSSTQITNSIFTEPLQKITAKTAKSTNAKPTTPEATTTKSTNTEPKTKSTTAKSTTAIPTTSKPTTKTEVTTIATTTETIPKQITTIPTTTEATIAKPPTTKSSTLKLTTTTTAKASTTKPSTTKSNTIKQKTAEETTEKATNGETTTPKPVIAKAKNATKSTTNTTQIGKSNSTNHSPSVNPGSGLSQLIKHRVSFPVLFMVMLVFIVAVYFGYHNRNKINHFLKEGFVKAKKGGSGYLKVKVEDGDYIELPRDANRQYVY